MCDVIFTYIIIHFGLWFNINSPFILKVRDGKLAAREQHLGKKNVKKIPPPHPKMQSANK